ncbi:UDP-2,4-diacetamido-2,4,6-trideoxy-beta-L-altropyranose hydrolase [Snuella lapsa]|uniref:UDP-2,4-diacetamido-2,4, 6-trideoxy-beta-L-altropyranose hydrolase n=1 Tax=Snuella lapsa TaxID=870481 RepID=A0ABP6XFI6_9FLAO
MKKKILFRADGNSKTGLGHLYRLLGLVEMIKDNYDFIYIINSRSVDSVIPKTIRVFKIPEEINLGDEPKWLSKNFTSKNHVIIADGYHFNSDYQKKIVEEGYSMIYIDDLAIEHMYANIVINHSISITERDFKKEAYTELLLGTKYALIRPPFLKAIESERNIEEINRAFVCFGGADPLKLSLKAVKALLKFEKIKQIEVILGAAYQDIQIYKLQEEFEDKIRIHSNLSDVKMCNLMTSCNFAIAPASTICYELCCVKVPILGGYFVDNQKKIYNGLIKHKAIIPGGDFSKYEVNDFEERIIEMLEFENYVSYLDQQKKLFDNSIKERFLNTIDQLC